jgi:hypothetical protein
MDFENDDEMDIPSDVEVSDDEEENEYSEKIKKQPKAEILTSKMLDKWSEDLTVSNNLTYLMNRLEH